MRAELPVRSPSMVLHEKLRRDASAPRGRPRRVEERGTGAPENGRSVSAGRSRVKAAPLKQRGKEELSLESEAARAVRELTGDKSLGAPQPQTGRAAVESAISGAPLARHRRSESWGSDSLSCVKPWSPDRREPALVRGASAVPGHTLEATRSLAGDPRAPQALGSRNGDVNWGRECGRGSTDPLEAEGGTDEERAGRGAPSTPGKRATRQRSAGGSRAGNAEDGARGKGPKGPPSAKGSKGPSGFQRIASKVFGKGNRSLFQRGAEEPVVRPRKATWTGQFLKPTKPEVTPNNSDPLLPTSKEPNPEDEGFGGGVPLRRHSDESSDRSLSRSTSFQDRPGLAKPRAAQGTISSASRGPPGVVAGAGIGESGGGAGAGAGAAEGGGKEDIRDFDKHTNAAPEAAGHASSGQARRDWAGNSTSQGAKSPDRSGAPEPLGRTAGSKELWIPSSSGSNAGVAAPDEVAAPRGSRPLVPGPPAVPLPAPVELPGLSLPLDTSSPAGSTSQSALDDDSVVYHANPREDLPPSELDDMGLEQMSPTAEMTRDFPDPILVLGRTTMRIIAANTAALRALGMRSQGEARRRSLMDLMERMPRKEWDEAVGRLMARELGQVKLKLRLLKSERGGHLNGHRVDLDLHLAGHGSAVELVGLLRKSSASPAGLTLHGSSEAHRLGIQGALPGHHPQDKPGRHNSGLPPGNEGEHQGPAQGQGLSTGAMKQTRASPGKAAAARNVSEPLVRPKGEAPRPKHASAPLRDSGGRLTAGSAAPGVPGADPLPPLMAKKKLLIAIPHIGNGDEDEEEYSSDETDADAPLATPLNSSDILVGEPLRASRGPRGGAPEAHPRTPGQVPHQEGFEGSMPLQQNHAPQKGQRTPRDADEAVNPPDRSLHARPAKSPGMPRGGSGSFAVRKEREREREAERGAAEKHEDVRGGAGRFKRAPTWNGTEGKARGPAVSGGEGKGRHGSVGPGARTSPHGAEDTRGAPEEEAWQSDPQRKGVARVSTWNASDSESRAGTGTGVMRGLGQLLWKKPEGAPGPSNSLSSSLGSSLSTSFSSSVRLLRPGEPEGRSSSRGRGTPRGEPLSVAEGGSGPIFARTRSAHRGMPSEGAPSSSKSPRPEKPVSLEARSRRTSEDSTARRNSMTRRDRGAPDPSPAAISATSPGAALERKPSRGRGGATEGRGVPQEHPQQQHQPPPLVGARLRPEELEPGLGPELNRSASAPDANPQEDVNGYRGPGFLAMEGRTKIPERAAVEAGTEGAFADEYPGSDGEDTVLAQPVGTAEGYSGGVPEALQEAPNGLRGRLPVASEMPVARLVARAPEGAGAVRPRLQVQVPTEFGEGEEGGAGERAGEGMVGVQTPGRQLGRESAPSPRLDSAAGIIQPGAAGQRERKVTFAENVHLRRFVRVGSAKHATAPASTSASPSPSPSPSGHASDGGHSHTEASPGGGGDEPSPSDTTLPVREGQGRRFVRQPTGRGPDKEGAAKEPSPRGASFPTPGLPRASSLGDRDEQTGPGGAATHYYVPLKEGQATGGGGGPGLFPRVPSHSSEGEGKRSRGASPARSGYKASTAPGVYPGETPDDPILNRARTWSETEGKGPAPAKGSSGPLVARVSSARSGNTAKGAPRNQSASARDSRAALREAGAASDGNLSRSLTADRPVSRSVRQGKRGEGGAVSKGAAPDTLQQAERLIAKLQEDRGVPRESPAPVHRGALRSSGAEDEGGTGRGHAPKGGTSVAYRQAQPPQPRPFTSARESRASRAGSGRQSGNVMAPLDLQGGAHFQQHQHQNHPQQQHQHQPQQQHQHQQHQHHHQHQQPPHLAHQQPQHLHPPHVPYQHENPHLQQQYQHQQQPYQQHHEAQAHIPQAKFRAVGFRSHSERAAVSSGDGLHTESLAAFASDSPGHGMGVPKQWPERKASMDTRDPPPLSPSDIHAPTQRGSPGYAVLRPRVSRLWQTENGGPAPASPALGEPPSGLGGVGHDAMAHPEYAQGSLGSYQHVPDDIHQLRNPGMGVPGVHPGYATQGVDQQGWGLGPPPGGGGYSVVAPGVPGAFQGMPPAYDVSQSHFAEVPGQHWGASHGGSGAFPWDASWSGAPHHGASQSVTGIPQYAREPQFSPAPHE